MLLYPCCQLTNNDEDKYSAVLIVTYSARTLSRVIALLTNPMQRGNEILDSIELINGESSRKPSNRYNRGSDRGSIHPNLAARTRLAAPSIKVDYGLNVPA